MNSKDYYEVECIDISYEGLGVCRVNNFIIFVPNLITGEKAKIKINKIEKNYGYGELVELINSSEFRIETEEVYGGSDLSHISYDYQIKIKENIVNNIFTKKFGKVKINKILDMKSPFNYRNKAKVYLGFNNKKLIYGYYKNKSHEIIQINNSIINSKKINELLNIIIDVLNEYKVLNIKSITIKEGFKTEEFMIIFDTETEEIKNIKEIISNLLKKFKIKTIIQRFIINYKEEEKILYGEGFIYDIIGSIKLKISSKSFFQVNPVQTEILYNKAIEIANLNKEDIVLDAYSGIGSIGLYLSKHVKKVYGIEIIKEAVEDAKENAQINNIKNAEFTFGDVDKEILKLKNDKINVVFLDPPRKGCSKSFLNVISETKPQKIIYISCNINTQVNDIENLLNKGYEIKEVIPVDMFPHTHHVESIVFISRRKDNNEL